jgi:DNA-binding IclR family transcriptional regulator
MAQVLFGGREQMEDEPRAKRPSTSKTDDNVERIRSLVRSDRRFTFRMISNDLNLNRFTVHQILTGFGHEKSVRQDGSKELHD